jgi:thiol:disulfide interchange protein
MDARWTWRVVGLQAVLVCLSGCSGDRSPEPVAEQPAAKTATPEVPPNEASPVPVQWQDHAQGLPFVMSYEKGMEMAKSQDKPAMLFVTTTWCGWCTKLAKENFNDPEVKDLLKNFVCVIVDGDTEKDAKTQLGATRGYPHIIFVSAGGNKLADCLGYKPVSAFKPIVQNALQRSRSG